MSETAPMLRTGVCAVAVGAALLSTLGIFTESWTAWEVDNLAADDATEKYQMGLVSWKVNAKVGFIEHTVTGDYADSNCDHPYDILTPKPNFAAEGYVEDMESFCEYSNENTDFYLKTICNIGVFNQKGSDEKIEKVMKKRRTENRNNLLRFNQIEACKAVIDPRSSAATYALLTFIFTWVNAILSFVLVKEKQFPKMNIAMSFLFIVCSTLAFFCLYTYSSGVSSVVFTRGIQTLGYSYQAMYASACLCLVGFGAMLFDDGEKIKAEEKEEFDEESEISETSEQES